MKLDKQITPELFNSLQECYFQLVKDWADYSMQHSGSIIDLSSFDTYQDFLADMRGELNPSIIDEEDYDRTDLLEFFQDQQTFFNEYLASPEKLLSAVDWQFTEKFQDGEPATLRIDTLCGTLVFFAHYTNDSGEALWFNHAFEKMIYKVMGQYNRGETMEFTPRHSHVWFMEGQNYDANGELYEPEFDADWYLDSETEAA